MKASINKLIAILMLLLLPVSWSSAIAESLAMNLADAPCHQPSSAPVAHDAGAAAHHHHVVVSHDTDSLPDGNSKPCHDCGICHLGCAGYLAVPDAGMTAVQSAAREITPYLVSFVSVSSAPLDPPPLARI